MDVVYTTLLEVCDVCGNQHPTESCPELGLNTTGLVGETKSRARLTLPDFLFELDIAGEVGVFTRDSVLQKKTQFGPFEAKKTTHEFSDEGVFILKVTTKDGTCISLDTTSENDCNWMCLIRAALTTEEQNCIAYQMGMNLYYSTTKDVLPGTELRVWYAPAYARRIGKPERPDGVSKVMLGMKVIYPSVEHLPDTEQTESYVDKEKEGGSEVIVPSDTREEVTSNFPCKRCGECFETESCLALHLRQHIIPGYSPLTHGKQRKTLRHLPKKRGRKPKKALITVERKEVESTEEFEGEAESDTVGGEESLKDEGEKEANSDEEFTPVIIPSTRIQNEGRRIQPRRSLKGKRTSGFEADENFVYVKVKTEKPDDGYEGSTSKNKDGEETVDVVPPCETSVSPIKEKEEDDMDVKTPPTKRRKRGRPPKVKVTENLAVTNSPQTSSNEDHVGRKESLPEETDDSKKKTITVENETVNKNTILNSEEDERCDPHEREDQNTTNSAEITNVRNIAQTKDDIKSSLSPAKDENENPSCQTGSGDHVDLTDLNKNVQEVESGIHHNGGPSHEDNNMSTHEAMETSSVNKTQSSGETTMVETSSDLIEPAEENIDDTNSSVNLVSSQVGESNMSTNNTDGIHVPTVESIANMTVDDDLQNILDELDKTDRNVQRNSSSLNKVSDISVKKKEILTGSELTQASEQEKGVAADKDTQTPPDVDEEKSTDGKDEEGIIPFIQSGEDPEGEQSDLSAMPFHDYVVKLVKSTDELQENAVNDEPSKLLSADKMVVEVDSKEDYVKYMNVEDTADGKHYICTLCDKKFLHEKYLRLHFPAHTGKFKCKKCGAKFCRNDTLKRHQCTNSTKGPKSQKGSMLATCDICNQQFANEKYLFRHFAIHTNIFQCQKCRKSFSRKDSLQRHVLKCCPEEAENYSVFFCRKCQKTFATKLGRDNHETHCKQKMCELCQSVFASDALCNAHTCQFKYESGRNSAVKYNCSHCPKSFSNLNYLKQHLQIHEGGYICQLCGRKLKTKEEKDDHEMMCMASSVIQSEGKTACPTCGLSFTDIKLYREHYHSHTHPHQCSKCLKRFVKIGSLHSHVCSVEEDKNMLFSCTICNKDFRNERMLMRHKEIHQDHKIECQHCNKKFYRKDCYLKHVCKEADGSEMDVSRNAELRAQQEKLVCHICGKNFVSSSNLNKHMKVHGEKTCVCHICNKKFHYFEYLRVHLDGFHNKKHQFQCSECGKILTSKPGLTSHVKQFHSDEKETHPCPTCGKVFSQKGNMKTHMYSHTKERGFHCTFCTKAFKYPDQLNRHKLIHTMQNKLQCDHCDKKFTKMYDLKKHFELFHSGMMYVCDVCGARTGHRHTMVRHYKRKHPETAEQAKEPSYLDSLFKHVDKEPAVTNEEIIEDQLTSDGMQVNTVSNMICAEEFVPQSAAEVLQSLSNTAVAGDQPIIVADGAAVIQNPDGTISMPGQEGTFSIQNIQQTVEGPDGQSTVVILQFVSQQDQDGVTQHQEVQVQELDTQVITTGAIQGASEEVEAYVQSYVVSGEHLQETV